MKKFEQKFNQSFAVACLFAAFLMIFPFSVVNAESDKTAEGNQVNNRNTQIAIFDKSCEINNGQISISFDMAIFGKRIRRHECFCIRPIYQGGDDIIMFPALVVTGKGISNIETAQKRLERRYKADGAKFFSFYNCREAKRHPNGKRISYSYVESFPSNLPLNGSIKLVKYKKSDKYIYNLAPDYIKLKQQESKIVKKPSRENLNFFESSNSEQFTNKKKSIELRFAYLDNSVKLVKSLADNREEFEKLNHFLSPIFSNSEGYTVNSIKISAFCSPEGTFIDNQRVSELRAKRVADYIKVNCPFILSDSVLTCVGAGEDWLGLAAMVKSSNMKFKKEILDIIEHVDIFKGREKKLMDLHRGEPYKYMYKYMFPSLRKTVVEIDYTERQENVDEHAVKTTINKAAEAMLAGDADLARSYLVKVSNDPRSYNNIGVYYWMIGDNDKARQYFNKALNADYSAFSAGTADKCEEVAVEDLGAFAL